MFWSNLIRITRERFVWCTEEHSLAWLNKLWYISSEFQPGIGILVITKSLKVVINYGCDITECYSAKQVLVWIMTFRLSVYIYLWYLDSWMTNGMFLMEVFNKQTSFVKLITVEPVKNKAYHRKTEFSFTYRGSLSGRYLIENYLQTYATFRCIACWK